MDLDPPGLVFTVSFLIVGFLGYSTYRNNKSKGKSESKRQPATSHLASIPKLEVPNQNANSHNGTLTPPISYAFVDLETTGLDTENDRITEICVFIVTPGVSSHSGKSTLINPGRPLTPFITELTGITDDMLKDKGGEESLHEYFDFIGDRPVYAYHAPFDMGFLKAAASRLGRSFNNESKCILQRLRDEHPNLRSYKLGDACESFGISVDGDAHRAEGDVRRALALWNAINDGKQPSTVALKLDRNAPEYSVYGHYRNDGVIFYVWTARNGESTTPVDSSLWSLYVEKVLFGQYEIRCLSKDLSLDQAIDLKDQLLAKHANQVLNRVNQSRGINMEIYEQSRSLRDTCEQNKQKGKALELSDPSSSLAYYKAALHNLDQYSDLIFENGLFGQFTHECYGKAQDGSNAIKIADRMSLLLCKMQQHGEARAILDSVFEKFPDTADTKDAEIITKRILKAAKIANPSA